jgi:hypothetical protein
LAGVSVSGWARQRSRDRKHISFTITIFYSSGEMIDLVSPSLSSLTIVTKLH